MAKTKAKAKAMKKDVKKDVKKDQKNKKKEVSNKKNQHKRGKADALTGQGWQAWMAHVARVGPTWLFVLFTLCHLLCCRVTEVLQLQFQDVDMETNRVKVKALKRRESMMKPMSPTLRKFLEKWSSNGGLSFTYTKKWGTHGLRTFQDHWHYPTDPEQYFFPPKRCDNKMGRLTKDYFLGKFQLSLTEGLKFPTAITFDNIWLDHVCEGSRNHRENMIMVHESWSMKDMFDLNIIHTMIM